MKLLSACGTYRFQRIVPRDYVVSKARLAVNVTAGRGDRFFQSLKTDATVGHPVVEIREVASGRGASYLTLHGIT